MGSCTSLIRCTMVLADTAGSCEHTPSPICIQWSSLHDANTISKSHLQLTCPMSMSCRRGVKRPRLFPTRRPVTSPSFRTWDHRGHPRRRHPRWTSWMSVKHHCGCESLTLPWRYSEWANSWTHIPVITEYGSPFKSSTHGPAFRE